MVRFVDAGVKRKEAVKKKQKIHRWVEVATRRSETILSKTSDHRYALTQQDWNEETRSRFPIEAPRS